MMRIISYNCNSVRNNFEIVQSLLLDSDILFLQELMLERRDLHVLNDLNVDFNHIAFVRDREAEGICEGRPVRGVAVFWRKELSPFISPVYIDDSMIGILIESNAGKVLLLNVYLPCDFQNSDSLDKYKCALAALEVVIREQNVNQVVIAGDFNADPSKGRFWKLLRNFTNSLCLQILDSLFEKETFTYLCPTKDSTSWLDHIVCTENLVGRVQNAFIDYNISLFDHFPLYFTLDVVIEMSPILNSANDASNRYVNWSIVKDHDIKNIQAFIDNMIVETGVLESNVLQCCDMSCRSQCHKDALGELFDKGKCILLRSTEKFCVLRSKSFRIIPGWNDNVKRLHSVARDHFLAWKESGKILYGKCHDDMKRSRSSFKTALRLCKINENNIRNRKLLDNLNDKNYKTFWAEVRKVNNHNLMSPSEIDGKSTDEDICQIFSEKYKLIFNRKQDLEKSTSRLPGLSYKTKVEILLRFSKDDVKEAIGRLNFGIGFDMIHSNHLKFATELFIEFLAMLFTSFIVHGFMPIDILKGIITPLVKDKFGSLSTSNNYRPVMSSSIFLKLFEYCLLQKIDPYVKLNDRQHGFRKKYSTSTACLSLKETIMNYTRSNSDVHGCFLDFSKAFDSVNHKILIDKLVGTGMPLPIVNLIQYWYSNQSVKVKYKSFVSESWKISNGVRQGGVLSGLFFNIYINALIDKISRLESGCRLGIIRSNIIAYADDIVLIAPSATSLQYLMDETNVEALKIFLEFNYDKSKTMLFRSVKNRSSRVTILKSYRIGKSSVENVSSMKYLGYILTSDLSDSNDIDKVKSKFYIEFNSVLRKFSFAESKVKLFLFRQYCLQFYGAELWFGLTGSLQSFRQFGVGYHKAIKKLLGLSSHESNHYACQESNLFLFEHFINKIRISGVLRTFSSPCLFIDKNIDYFRLSSVMVENVTRISDEQYQIDSITENDFEAIVARILYVQNHESQMRVAW